MPREISRSSSITVARTGDGSLFGEEVATSTLTAERTD
jgi:hypothetical protein